MLHPQSSRRDYRITCKSVLQAKRYSLPRRSRLKTARCITTAGMRQFLDVEPYTPPSWASSFPSIPKERLNLGLLPTPVHRWNPPGIPDGMELWIKRDDMSGNSLSGNKVRKLEFLLADALAKKCDSVITIGGIQSNHCRATAVASRYLQMTPHLILRNSSRAADYDPGLIGNVLVDRLVGSHVHQVTKKEYQAVGSETLVSQLESELREKGLNPYPIPVGGSNGLGTWGYIECINEIIAQIDGITDIIVACGSGATVGGLALGSFLCGVEIKIHAYIVCDNPDYFYKFVDGLYEEMEITHLLKGRTSRDLFQAIQAKGAGYAINRPEELLQVLEISKSTGVVLDPVYSGKAMFGFLTDFHNDPDQWKGKKVLFIHTGGLLGLYDKCDELQPMVENLKTTHRFQIKQDQTIINS